MSDKNYLAAPPPSTKLPGGIPYIVGNEAAERFSFYGMRAILTVFMTKHLMSTTGVEQDVMSGDEAKFWVHQFVAASYFFPILGALASDWLLGKYRTILSLSIVYCLGHLALALDESRIGLSLGLTLIAIGAGGIKPCVSAHVGDQFGRMNAHLLPRVFSWFYFAINVGAFVSTILTPKLLVWYGSHVAFGVPGGLMLLATWVFWLGRNKFVHVPPHGEGFFGDVFAPAAQEDAGESDAASTGTGGSFWKTPGMRALLNLALIYVFVAMFWALFDQTASAWVLQAESMDRTVLGYPLLSSQLQAINPILVLTLIPLFTYVIYPAIDKVFKLTPLRKISIGFFVTVLAFSVSAHIESNITGGQVITSSSQEDAEKTPARNLIDGEADAGWVSISKQDYAGGEKTLFPQEFVFRLRERRKWEISELRINPAVATVAAGDDDRSWFDRLLIATGADLEPAKSVSSDDWAKHVEIYTSATREGPWTPAAEADLKQVDALQSVSFTPVDTEYVKLAVTSNHGGDRVTLGRVEIVADGRTPSDAHAQAADVWPNVATMGHKPHVWWQFLAYVILTSAEIMVSITCLEFSYTQAPNKLKSIVMSLYLLSVSAGNEFTSVVNKVIQNADGTSKLPGASYYWFFTGAMLATAILFVFAAQFYRGRTYIQDEVDPDAETQVGLTEIADGRGPMPEGPDGQ